MKTNQKPARLPAAGSIAPVRDREHGYALLMVIFLAALVVIGTATAIPDLLTQGRREKETETIWRGEQYDRGIKLYYKKMGKYPQTLDDITKEQNGIHFMRQAYKNPMNTVDGSWRLIYVTQSGQLINSLRYASLQDMVSKIKPNSSVSYGVPPGGVPVNGAPLSGGSAGQQSGSSSNGSSSGTAGNSANTGYGAQGQTGQSGSTAGPAGSGSGTPGGGSGSETSQQSGTGTTGQPGQPGQPGAPVQGASGVSGGQPPQALNLDTSNADDSGQVYGGSLTGVAGKTDKASIKVFQGGKTYKMWEFIYNPLLDVASSLGGANGANPQQNPSGTLSQPGSAPSSLPFGQPPQQNPQQQSPSSFGGTGG